MAGSHSRTVPSPLLTGQELAVGAERHRAITADEAVRTGWAADGAAGGRVPQPRRAVAAGGGQQLAVGAERHRVHAAPGLAWRIVPTGRPVAGFHSRTVPSAPAVASSLPSGLNATARTPYRAVVRPLAWRVADGAAGGRVPQPHRAVAVGAGQQLAVGAERHRVHAVPGGGVQGRADGAAGGRVPQPHRAVGAGAGQQLAAGAERHRAHAVRVGGQHALLLLLGQQGRDGGRGLAGGEDGPGGDGEPARGHAIGAIDVEAFGGELAGQGDGMLVRALVALRAAVGRCGRRSRRR